ncbi:MAG: efflux transporter outer membrane subunit [Acidobacteria bacterium]|nr:efflux transporter outer membrane subunit [Acidobacteriota bacterium]
MRASVDLSVASHPLPALPATFSSRFRLPFAPGKRREGARRTAEGLGTLVLSLILSGCTMVPRYERPEMPVANSFSEAAGAVAAPVASIKWQAFFTDPKLRQVIEETLANNRDLRIATFNIEKAAALYRIQRAELSPTVGIQALGNKYRLPEKLGDKGEAKTVSQYSVNIGLAAWELDFFGRIRSQNERALELFLATEEARRAAQSSLIAAVAGAYLALAADGENLRLSQATLEAQTAAYRMIERTRDAGMGSDLDLRQAQSLMEAARASVAAYTGAVATGRNALAVLVGKQIDPSLLPDDFGTVAGSGALVAGLPSEVLLNRPDILAAEHQLRGANASIGAARAAFFPRISLTASAGTMSPDLAGLFESGTKTWSFAPQIVAPLFASGALLANLKAARIDREIAVAQYEKAIQTAFAEVNDALALRITLVAQREAQDALVKALAETARLSEARYRAGMDSYLGVIVAQRAHYDAQRAQVAVRLAEEANLVLLYKALGGGV